MAFPLIGAAALAAFGSVAGGMISAADSKAGRWWDENENIKNREFQKQEALRQMAFQDQQRSSAYQVAVEDMKKAGLNPITAAGGGGAQAMSGASASGSLPVNTGNEDRGAAIQKGIESAMAMASMQADLEKKEADTNLAKTETKVAETQAKVLTSTAKKASVDAKAAEASLPRVEAEAKLGKEQTEWDRWALDYDNVTRRATELINTGAGAVGRFLRGTAPKTPPKGPGEPRDASGRTRAEVERDSYKRQLKTYQQSQKGK